MKYYFYRLIIFFTLVLINIFASCQIKDQFKDEKETYKCIKEKSKKEQYKSIDEAIANFDFSLARKYLSCYPNVCYNVFESRVPCDGLYKDTNPYRFNLTKIVRAEVAFLINNNEISRAQNTALESNMLDIYQDVVKAGINTFLEKNDYQRVFTLLTTWNFKHTFNPNQGVRDNDYYNSESRIYNNLINTVIRHAIFNKDANTAKQCLQLYLPIAVEDSATGKSVTKHESREAAIQMIRDAGMRVN